MNESTTEAPPLSSKRVLKRIAPLQAGKILAILYGILGLLFLPVFLMIAAFGSTLPAQQRVGMMAMGFGMMIAMPVFYAVMGFVFGSLGALIYNQVAKWIGGFEVEVA